LVAVVATTFTFTPLRRASIHWAEPGFQTQGHVDEVVP
jgi:hypothetical protein